MKISHSVGRFMRVMKTVRFRLLFLQLTMVLMSMCVQLYIGVKTIHALEEEAIHLHQSTMAVYINRLDSSIDELDLQLIALSKNADINSMAIHDYGDDEYILAKFRARQTILNWASKLLFAISIYDARNGSIMSIPINSFEANDVSSQIIFSQEPYTYWTLVKYNGQYYFGRKLEINDDIQIVVSIRSSTFLEPINTALNTPVKMVAENGEILNPENIPDSVRQKIVRIATEPEAEAFFIDAGRIISHYDYKKLGIHYFSVSLQKEIYEKIPNMKSVIIGMMGTLILFSGMILLILQRSILNPLQALMQGIYSFSQRKLKKVALPKGDGEIVALINAFNGMVDELKSNEMLISMNQMEVQKLKMENLQGQIDPHFYSNVMNIIYNLAAMKEYGKIQRISIHLANYFRYLSNIGGLLVTIEKDVEYVRDYLIIQEIRFPDKLQYHIDLDDNCREMLVPSMLLQPIVENSFKYGFVNRREAFCVDIRIRLEKKDCLCIEITDTGEGYPEEMCGELNAERARKLSQDGHIGLNSIYRRLIISDVGEISIVLANGTEKGARTRITIRNYCVSGEKEVL